MNTWRDTKETTRLARWLAGLYRASLVGAVCLAVSGIGAGLYLAYQWLDRPIEIIRVKGKLAHLRPGELEAMVEPLIVGGIISLDLGKINQALQQHVWIKRANVSRQWANGLLIEVEEETPVARWRKQGFLNSTGEFLDIDDNSGLEGLTLLDGPDGEAFAVMQRYQEVAELLATRNLQVTVMRTDEAGNWQVDLANGVQLIMGRGQLIDKVHRFLRVWDAKLEPQLEKVASVDLRYGNGMAVTWRLLANDNG